MHLLARDSSCFLLLHPGRTESWRPACLWEALLTPWARSPGAPQEAESEETPHPTHLLPVAAVGHMHIFLFVSVIRGESTLIYIKW